MRWPPLGEVTWRLALCSPVSVKSAVRVTVSPAFGSVQLACEKVRVTVPFKVAAPKSQPPKVRVRTPLAHDEKATVEQPAAWAVGKTHSRTRSGHIGLNIWRCRMPG